jgi:hypothetical protein
MVWPVAKIQSTIWSSLIDYSRAAWLTIQRRKYKTKDARAEAIIQFDSMWTTKSFLYKQLVSHIRWDRLSRFDGSFLGLVFRPGLVTYFCN